MKRIFFISYPGILLNCKTRYNACTMMNIEWYHTLNKPFLSPPDWIFAPVWSFLYLLILISLIIFIWKGYCRNKAKPFILFVLQVGLNLLWPPVFFQMQNIKLGFIVLFSLWVVLILTIQAFYKCSKIAAILLIPYFLWITFALYLNFEILRLN